MASAAGVVAVIDYGMGNLRSVWQALVRVAPGREVVVTADPAVVASAERVVFPGQGAMPDCMRELDARGLRSAVLEAARSKPFLALSSTCRVAPASSSASNSREPPSVRLTST